MHTFAVEQIPTYTTTLAVRGFEEALHRMDGEELRAAIGGRRVLGHPAPGPAQPSGFGPRCACSPVQSRHEIQLGRHHS